VVPSFSAGSSAAQRLPMQTVSVLDGLLLLRQEDSLCLLSLQSLCRRSCSLLPPLSFLGASDFTLRTATTDKIETSWGATLLRKDKELVRCLTVPVATAAAFSRGAASAATVACWCVCMHSHLPTGRQPSRPPI